MSIGCGTLSLAGKKITKYLVANTCVYFHFVNAVNFYLHTASHLTGVYVKFVNKLQFRNKTLG